ncbi:MAG: GNAT family N-acetyltransferase [Bacteroidales bacterium]|nr:GNAT family N-acetyltransferase [Bacteroidales bacterium]
MTLETERLILRPWKPDDAERLFLLAKDPDVGPAAGWNPHLSVAESRDVIDTIFHLPTIYAVVLKESGEVIGCCGTMPDPTLSSNDREQLLGYWIGKPYWDDGYATEAAQKTIHHAFRDLGLSVIWCGCFAENTKSLRVQEKLGFVIHHIEQENTSWSDEPRNVIITRLEYQKAQASAEDKECNDL